MTILTTVNDSFLRPSKAQTSFKKLPNKISGNHYLSLEKSVSIYFWLLLWKKKDKKKTRYLTASHLFNYYETADEKFYAQYQQKHLKGSEGQKKNYQLYL